MNARDRRRLKRQGKPVVKKPHVIVTASEKEQARRFFEALTRDFPLIAVRLCVLLTGCTIQVDIEPLDPGVTLVVTDELSTHESELVQRSADAWNAAANGAVLSVQRGQCSDECGTVCVERLTQAERDRWHAPALTFADGCTARIALSEADDALLVRMVTHELGHVFLGGNEAAHNSDPLDVMGGGWTITASTAARVKGRME